MSKRALIASLPLISIPGMIWLRRDTGDAVRMAVHPRATFWFVLPELGSHAPVSRERHTSFHPQTLVDSHSPGELAARQRRGAVHKRELGGTVKREAGGSPVLCPQL